MIKKLEKDFNSWLIDWIIGGSYAGDYRPRFFQKLKKIGLEAQAHLLVQLERLRGWYKD